MYISDTNKKIRKTIVIYCIMSFILTVLGFVYTSFGHGVSSMAMSYMFLYPLFGAGGYILTHIITNNYNQYNFMHLGIATLSTGSFLKGILEIAGTGSLYQKWFYIIGYILILFNLGHWGRFLAVNKRPLGTVPDGQNMVNNRKVRIKCK